MPVVIEVVPGGASRGRIGAVGAATPYSRGLYVRKMTEGMRLRPFTESDLDRLEEMFDDPDAIGIFNWGGFRDRSVWRKRFADNRLLDAERNALMVDLHGVALGFVSWTKKSTGISYCFEFGISLWPEARGKGHGTAAQLMLARYLFAHDPVNRIQAYTEADNVAEQRALEKAGFVREAVLKGLCFRDGEWRDEVLYRMLRSELPGEPGPRNGLQAAGGEDVSAREGA